MNVPFERLRRIQDKLELGDAEAATLRPYSGKLQLMGGDFADYFHGVFMEFPETRIILEHEVQPGHLQQVWADWFGRLTKALLDDDFLTYLWRIGIRHTDVGLDQRFSNLGFSVARQFMHKKLMTEVPEAQRAAVANVLDKLIDFCLLVETSAYIARSTKCNMDLIEGVADKVRNKITIIGGFVRRLQKGIAPDDPSNEIFKCIIDESTMCENMVRDISTYNDVLQREPEFEKLELGALVGDALEGLGHEERFGGVAVEVDIDPVASVLYCDRKDIGLMMHCLIENALEAAGGENPLVRITSDTKGLSASFLRVTVFNTGIPPKEEMLEKLYQPFHSTKPGGTGFGLPIAALAAKKNYGRLVLEPLEGEGTRAVVLLPVPA